MIDGDVVRELRNCLNLTQAEFAANLGVSESLLSLWEIDKRKVHGSANVLLKFYLRALFEIFSLKKRGPYCVCLKITPTVINKMTPPNGRGALLKAIFTNPE